MIPLISPIIIEYENISILELFLKLVLIKIVANAKDETDKTGDILS